MSSAHPYDPSDSGLLLVFAEPGKDVSLNEFQDWYNNEHVPLRTEHFPSFRSAARYTVSSTASSASQAYIQTTWAALYTISPLSVLFSDPAYTRLRTERSKRESDVLARIGVLDRRIYRLTYDSDVDPAYASLHRARADLLPQAQSEGEREQGDARTASISNRPIKAEHAPPVVIATSVTPAQGNQEAYDEWYLGEHVEALSRVPGWRRTRRFELVDALIIGRDAARDNGDAGSVPRCLGLHEYASPDFSSTPEFAAALNTPWRTRVMREDNSGIAQQERRVMSLYRAWDPTAALAAAVTPARTDSSA
ncbi:Coatomer subunit beta' [Tilletia horrida]|nr:Coatomer subunit beta' [Tilletia horrida]